MLAIQSDFTRSNLISRQLKGTVTVKHVQCYPNVLKSIPISNLLTSMFFGTGLRKWRQFLGVCIDFQKVDILLKRPLTINVNSYIC